jgi:hypothetical protein
MEKLINMLQSDYGIQDEADAIDAAHNLLGFFSTLIEINNETKVVKNDPDDK